MKAVILSRYGSPDVLSLEEIEKPSPRAGEVLVKIRAAGVNDWDWAMVRGKPRIYRLLFGLRKPKVRVPGVEIAGVVEATGSGAVRFRPGDRVYGDLSDAGFGGFAEYARVRETALAALPAGMTFEQGAARPHAGLLALQGLVDLGKIRRGDRVLINGAGGGVGMFAVRIARRYGCEVTGVDRDFKLATLKASGYDHVIDYRKHDFTAHRRRYDLILDAKTDRSPFRYLKALKPGGRYVTVGGELPRLLQILGTGLLMKLCGLSGEHGKSLKVLALKPNQGLDELADLLENNDANGPIEGPYRLDELPRALARFGEGLHIGKVVITVS